MRHGTLRKLYAAEEAIWQLTGVTEWIYSLPINLLTRSRRGGRTGRRVDYYATSGKVSEDLEVCQVWSLPSVVSSDAAAERFGTCSITHGSYSLNKVLPFLWCMLIWFIHVCSSLVVLKHRNICLCQSINHKSPFSLRQKHLNKTRQLISCLPVKWFKLYIFYFIYFFYSNSFGSH